MNPDLERRLRRFGATVDRAAEAAQQRRPTGGTEPGDLEHVVSLESRRATGRIVATIAASAAALIGVVVVAARNGSDGGGADPAASGDRPAFVVESTDATVSSPPSTDVPVTEPAGPLPSPSSTVVPTIDVPTTSAAPPSTIAATRPPQTTRSPVCPSYRQNATLPLRLCDQSEAVRQVQVVLGVNDDGYFGPGTRAAVEQFQRDHGLEVDGLVGPATWAALFPGGTTTTAA